MKLIQELSESVELLASVRCCRPGCFEQLELRDPIAKGFNNSFGSNQAIHHC